MLFNVCNSLITAEQPSELEVVNAISSLNQWFELGQQLGLPYDVLEAIEIDCDKHGTKRQRSKMVHTWLQREPAASWSKLCGALDRMGERALAQDIREKQSTGEHCGCGTIHDKCVYKSIPSLLLKHSFCAHNSPLEGTVELRFAPLFSF